MKSGHSQLVPLKVWLLVGLTLLARTSIVMPLDYDMKFKFPQNQNQG